MPLPHITTGELTTAALWNNIIDDLNSLTGALTGSGTSVGVGGVTPTRTLHVYGSGQATPALADAGNPGGTAYVQDALGAPGSGGAVIFGSQQGHFAALKGLLTDGAGGTVGDLAIALRRATGDTALTEVVRCLVNGTVRLVHGLECLSILSPAQITGHQHDYAPAGLAQAFYLRLNTDASRNLTGIAAPTTGRMLLLANVGAFDLVLTHDDAGSDSANRFALKGNVDYALTPNASVWLYYDNANGKWRAVLA